MRSHLQPIAFAAALAVTSSSVLADITVGPTGSGAQTDNIEDAIFNADEGETIYVFAGDYPAIRVIGKSVRIVGEGSNLVTFAFDDPDTFGPGSRIEGLGPNQRAFFSGVSFDLKASTALNSTLNLVSNRGPVFFHDCEFRSSVPAGGSSVQAFGCDYLFFDQCRFLGFEPEIGADPIVVSGGNAISIDESVVRMNACFAKGGDANQSGLFFSTGGAGINVLDSLLLAHNCSFEGGNAQVSPASGVNFGAAAGVEAQDSTIVLTGGVGSDGTPAPVTVLNGSTATVELFQRPGLTPSAPKGSPGTSFTLAFDGEPGSSHLLAFAQSTVAPYSLGGVSGLGLLNSVGVELFALIGMDANGTGSVDVDLPALPSLAGVSGFFQSLQTGTALGARVSLPCSFLVTQ